MHRVSSIFRVVGSGSRGRVMPLLALPILALFACGGAVDGVGGPEDRDAATVDGGGDGPRRDGGPIGPDGGPLNPDGGPIGPDGGPFDPDGGPIGRDGGPFDPDGGPIFDATPDGFVETPCGPVPLPPTEYECDPNVQNSCGPMLACMPFVIYPQSRCEPERFGSTCTEAGTSTQGEPCDGQTCVSGHICVVTGAGNQCAKTCDTATPRSCPSGLVCGPTDIPGTGVCL